MKSLFFVIVLFYLILLLFVYPFVPLIVSLFFPVCRMLYLALSLISQQRSDLRAIPRFLQPIMLSLNIDDLEFTKSVC